MNYQKEITELEATAQELQEQIEALKAKAQDEGEACEKKRERKLGDVYLSGIGKKWFLPTESGYFDSKMGFVKDNDCSFTCRIWNSYKYAGQAGDVFVLRKDAFTREQLKEKFAKMKDSDGDSHGEGYSFIISREDGHKKNFIDNLLDNKHCSGTDVHSDEHRGDPVES
jgi:hypothetical protein